jgi:hypothetical protein
MRYLMRNGMSGEAKDFVEVDVQEKPADGSQLDSTEIVTAITALTKAGEFHVYCRLMPILMDVDTHKFLLSFFASKAIGDVTVFTVSSQHYLKSLPTRNEAFALSQLLNS